MYNGNEEPALLQTTPVGELTIHRIDKVIMGFADVWSDATLVQYTDFKLQCTQHTDI